MSKPTANEWLARVTGLPWVSDFTIRYRNWSPDPVLWPDYYWVWYAKVGSEKYGEALEVPPGTKAPAREALRKDLLRSAWVCLAKLGPSHAEASP